jgi:hypothetical protein
MSAMPQHEEAESEPEAELDIGGLNFGVAFRAPSGATLRVSAPVEGTLTEVLRFDDFVDLPHYHVPASGPATMFDREALGAPLDWFVDQIGGHMGELLTEAGFGAVLPAVDLDAVAAHAGDIREAMESCVPEGYARVPGVGLQRVEG